MAQWSAEVREIFFWYLIEIAEMRPQMPHSKYDKNLNKINCGCK